MTSKNNRTNKENSDKSRILSSKKFAVGSRTKKWFSKKNTRIKSFLSRRPHRSFRLTMRRDYKRSLKLPGYWSLTKQLFHLTMSNKRIFFGLVIIFAFLMIIMSSLMSQNAYQQLKDMVGASEKQGSLDSFFSTMTLFMGVAMSQLTGTASGGAGSTQQIIGILLGLFEWLATIWLLRSIMAGQHPKIRDGIYSCGSPVLSLMSLVAVFILQMMPAAMGFIIYAAADNSDFLAQTAVLMLIGGITILLIVMSIYWVTSTIIAMVIVTLPGMYPMQALRLAGDVVIGRRIRILFRLLWGVFLLAIVWLAILIPVILIDGALKNAMPILNWMPLVPFAGLLLTSFSVVLFAGYVYTFYRKVVEDDSAPA